MNISEVANKSGVTPKMIRRYEELQIIQKAKRNMSGYRQYQVSDIHILSFIKRSRELGFSMKDTKQLVSLWQNKKRSSAQVKTIALEHINELERKLKETQSMLTILKNLANHCHGDKRAQCPIIEDLESI